MALGNNEVIKTVNDDVIKILKFSEINDVVLGTGISLKPNEWRSIASSSLESTKIFILKIEAAQYFFSIKKVLREYYSEKNHSLSEKYLDKSINDFLILCKSSKISNLDVVSYVKEWLERFDSLNLQEYTILLPVNHYDYRGDLTMDNINIVKIDDDLIKKYFIINEQIHNELYDANHFIESNHTDIGAVVTVTAHDIDEAKYTAEEILDKFIFLIKLFDHNSFISTRKSSYKSINYVIFTYNKSNKFQSSSISKYYPLCEKPPSKEFYKNLENTWKKLTSFLYSKHLTAFQKSILDSMYWYGSVDNLRDSNVKKFLYYLIGLEKLLLKKHERQKGKKFGERSAIIFSGDQRHADFYKKYYDKRNDLVHDENARVYDEEVTTLRIDLRSLLLDMIEHSDKYKDVKSYYDDKHKIDL